MTQLTQVSRRAKNADILPRAAASINGFLAGIDYFHSLSMQTPGDFRRIVSDRPVFPAAGHA